MFNVQENLKLLWMRKVLCEQVMKEISENKLEHMCMGIL